MFFFDLLVSTFVSISCLFTRFFLGLLKLSFFPGTIAKVIFFEWADTEQIITAGPYEKKWAAAGIEPIPLNLESVILTARFAISLTYNLQIVVLLFD